MWDNVTVLIEHTSGTPHHDGTPLENSGTPWGVQYTRLTSTALGHGLCVNPSLSVSGLLLERSPFPTRLFLIITCKIYVISIKTTKNSFAYITPNA